VQHCTAVLHQMHAYVSGGLLIAKSGGRGGAGLRVLMPQTTTSTPCDALLVASTSPLVPVVCFDQPLAIPSHP
jgi:hypothetical protein